MRFAGWAGFALAVAAVGGCDDCGRAGDASTTSAAATATSAAAPRTLAPSPGADGATPADCEAYVAALERCIAKQPPQGRAPLQAELDRQRKALERASPPEKQALASGCQMGLSALKQNPACL